MNTKEQYIEMVNKVQESRDLLATKLKNFHIINNEQAENEPFYDLLQHVNPTTFHPYKTISMPAVPQEDPSLPHIQSASELKQYLYTNNKSKILTKEKSLIDLNYIILKKTLFYKEYLQYRLYQMDVDSFLVREAKTIKNLIKLLDIVNRKKYTRIELDLPDELYYQVENEIDVTIYDDSDNKISFGEIEIYVNDIFIQRQKVTQPCIIIPPTLGTNTIKIKYVESDRYFSSETDTYSLNVVRGMLVPTLNLQNITTTSIYYDDPNEENGEPFEGYSEDSWDLYTKITNLRNASININVPFIIYLEDKNHILFNSVTDLDGTKNFNNIKIPYHNADFIDMENDIESIEILDTPIEYDNETILDNLSFIKNISIENGVISYDTVDFTPKNYVDELNGCISNIHIDNNYNLAYDVFQTNQHIQIQSLSNPKQQIGHLITNIVYYQNILYTEIAKQQDIKINYIMPKEYLNLIIESQLQDTPYENDYNIYQIGLYYPALLIDDNLLTWYKDSPTVPEKIPIIMADMYTGRIIRDYGPKIIIITDNQNTAIKDHFNTSKYNLIPSSNLPYGKTKFTISICTNTPSYVYQSINWKNITTLSFYYKSEEYGLLDVYIGNEKIASLTMQTQWTQFTYNDVQNLFNNNTTNYQRELKFVNVISFTHIDIDTIYVNKTNAIVNNNFENGLQAWKYEGNVNYANNGQSGYYLQLTNERHCNVVNKEFNILSNFELPKQTIYYLNYTPDIYYKPLGQIKKDKEVIIHSSQFEGTFKTDGTGLLTAIKSKKDVGTYELQIIGNSDGVYESIYYSYEIRKPFIINDLTNSIKEAKYEVVVYDLEHTCDIKVIHNNNNITVPIITTTTSNSKVYTVTIPRNLTTVGENILKVSMNSYTEQRTFTLTIPNMSCITNVNLDNNGDLIVDNINRLDIDNTTVITDITLSDGDLITTTKTIIYPYDSVQGVITNISIDNNGDIEYTKYAEDD